MLSYCAHILTKACANSLFKLFGTSTIILFGYLFDVQLQTALEALLILIVMDFFSAILAAYKTGEPVRSRLVFRTALKTAVYFTLISAGFLSEKAVPIAFLDDTILGFLVLTELVSLIENAGRAGYAVPKVLLNKLQDLRDSK